MTIPSVLGPSVLVAAASIPLSIHFVLPRYGDRVLREDVHDRARSFVHVHQIKHKDTNVLVGNVLDVTRPAGGEEVIRSPAMVVIRCRVERVLSTGSKLAEKSAELGTLDIDIRVNPMDGPGRNGEGVRKGDTVLAAVKQTADSNTPGFLAVFVMNVLGENDSFVIRAKELCGIVGEQESGKRGAERYVQWCMDCIRDPVTRLAGSVGITGWIDPLVPRSSNCRQLISPDDDIYAMSALLSEDDVRTLMTLLDSSQIFGPAEACISRAVLSRDPQGLMKRLARKAADLHLCQPQCIDELLVLLTSADPQPRKSYDLGRALELLDKRPSAGVVPLQIDRVIQDYARSIAR